MPRSLSKAGNGRTLCRKAIRSTQSKFASDKRHGWAVGGDGVILSTSDGGFEWDEEESRANTTLYSVYLKDRNHLVVSGARGTILTTKNGGDKWVSRKTGTRDHLFSVSFAPDNPLRGWAVGTFGAIIFHGGWWRHLETADQQHNSSSLLRRFHKCEDRNCCGSRGTVLVTNNGGADWKEKKDYASVVLTGVTFTSAKRAVVVGYRGTILQTDDAG